MKLQNLTVIFVIIMIPIILVTSYYIQLQIDTVTMQTDYKTKLIKAAKDSIEAFEINSVQWNSEYSSTTDSKRRNINASVNTFITSFANALGIGGTSKEYMINYIPAILYTMYDGYYIYSLAQEESGNYTHLLQPFVPYTELLTSGNDWIVINYTLDNYIEIYGEISGAYVEKQGYLTASFGDISVAPETLREQLATYNGTSRPDLNTYKYVYDENNVKTYYDSDRNKFFTYYDGEKRWLNDRSEAIYKKYIASSGDVYYQLLNDKGDGSLGYWYGVDSSTGEIDSTSSVSGITISQTEDCSALNYYNQEVIYNGSFTKWFNENIAGRTWDSKTLEVEYKFEQITGSNDPDPVSDNYKSSSFTQHKEDVIQKSIEENLDNAMLSSTARGSVSYDFRLPELKATDWEQLFSNVSVIAFVQGLPIGNKYFNNYAIVTSTKNNEYVDPNEIYFSSTNDEYYHKYGRVNEGTNSREFGCNSMTADASTYIGYKGTDFVIKSQDWKDTSNNTHTIYYYSHYDNRNMKGSALACYDCLVDRQKDTSISGDDSSYKNAYYTALARERYVSHEFR